MGQIMRYGVLKVSAILRTNSCFLIQNRKLIINNILIITEIYNFQILIEVRLPDILIFLLLNKPKDIPYIFIKLKSK